MFGYVIMNDIDGIRNLTLTDVGIIGKFYVGGLIGDMVSGTISRCSVSSGSMVRISGIYCVGGLAGIFYDGQIQHCEVDANVWGSSNVGGLIGYFAGYIGNNSTEIYECRSSGTISGEEHVGGLAGYSKGAIINKSFSSGSVVAYNCVGGFIGSIDQVTISDSYATGDVVSKSGTGVSFGSFIGKMENGGVNRCYSTGGVSGNGWSPTDKGFLGEYVSGTLTGNYWDTESSGQTSSAGQGAGQLEGKTTAEMKQQPTFVNWNFNNIWAINPLHNDGYPHLQWEYCTNPAEGGTIADSQTICSGSIPEPIISLTTPAGHSGVIEYKWQFSVTSESENFEDIISSNTMGYAPGVLNQTTWYRRLARVDCMADWSGAAVSNVVQISVNPSPIFVTMLGGATLKDGSSWETAYDQTQLQQAINEACDQVWVAAGTYYPTVKVGGTSDRNKAFQMKEGISIFGGFAGNEAFDYDKSLRDFDANQTILSGDIGTPGVNTDNCYHVFYHPQGLGLTSLAVLDGFTITGGNANGSNPHYDGGGIFNYSNSPVIKNCIITGNTAPSGFGGGMANYSSSPQFINCFISDNDAYFGGGVLNAFASPAFTNCVLNGNVSVSDGGAIYHNNGTMTLNNVTIVGNHSGYYGGGIMTFNETGVLTVNNGVMWGNTATNGGNQLYVNLENSGGMILNYTCYSNETNDMYGTMTVNNCITSNPMLLDAAGGDLRLCGISPCVDMGNDVYNNEIFDIRGNGFDRKLLGTDHTQAGPIDMGAYEYNKGADPEIQCYNPSNGGIIAASQTICYDQTPEALTCISLPTSYLGTLEYKWQFSATGETSGFEDISNSNATSYAPEALTETTWFRRLARVDCMTDWSGAAQSNVIKVTVYDDFTPGAIETTGETICYGGDPDEIGSSIDASGGDENITYAWYSSINDFADSALIVGATLKSYDPPNGLTETTSYRRYAKDATCNTNFEPSAGTWEVIVYDDFNPGEIETTGETICYGGDPSVILGVVYDNGTIVNSPGTGFNGADESILLYTYGWCFNYPSYRLADDFTLTDNNVIHSVIFQGYQTNSTTTSTFTGLYFRIYDGEPGNGGQVIWGDTINNRLTSSSFSNIYRVPYAGSSSLSRPVMNLMCNNLNIPLAAGTYWIEWAAQGTLSSGPWVPCTKDSTGNALIYDLVTWVPVVPTGTTNGRDFPFILTNSIAANGGDGNITYQWQKSIVGPDSGFTDIPGASLFYYDPPAGLTEDTWYRRQAHDGSCNTTWETSTGIWKVEVNSDFAPGAIETTGETICYGGDPSQIGSLTDASGGDENITYAWYRSINNFYDSTLIVGATLKSYNPPTGLTKITRYRRYAKDATCNTDFELSEGTWEVTLYDDFTPGYIETIGETICYGGDPIEIGSVIDASGGDENITYAWYSSTNNFSDSTLIVGAMLKCYDPPAGITEPTSYRRYAKDGNCNTNYEPSVGTWKVSFYNDFNPGEIETTGETIFNGGDPSVIAGVICDNGTIVNSPGTGFNGADESILLYTYGWCFNYPSYRLADDFTLTDNNVIHSVIFQGYQTNSTTTSTFTGLYFRIYDGEPGNGGQVIWGDTINNRLTSSSFSNIYRVSQGSSGSISRPVMNLMCTNLNIPLAAGTYWIEWAAQGTLSSGPWAPCTKDSTGNAIRNDFVAWEPVVPTGTTNGRDFPFTLINSIAANGGDGNITYQWQKSIVGPDSGFTDIPGASLFYYDPPAGLTEDTWYRRQAHDGSCNTTWETSTGIWKVAIYRDFTPGAIETTGETICYGGDPAQIGSLTDASGGDENITYTWYSSINNFADSTLIIGATLKDHNPPAGLTETTSYRRYANDETFNTSPLASTGTWTVTVYDDFAPGTIETTGETICYGGAPAQIGSLTDASGGDEIITYAWYSSNNDFADSALIVGVMLKNYNPPAGLNTTTSYRRYAKDGTCNLDFVVSAGTWSVTVQPLPIAYADADATISQEEAFNLSDAYAENHESVSWSSTGDGTWSDSTLVNPVYTPGANDIAHGSAELCITALPQNPCTLDSTDCMTLTFVPWPNVEIINPIQASHVYNKALTVSGTASFSFGEIERVEICLNNGNWQTATGTQNWLLDVELSSGKNTIGARAVDTSGLQSLVKNVEVILSVQIITIPQGWSYISSYLTPTDPNIVNMFADIVAANNLSILTGVNGIYAPDPFFINTFGSWDVLKGYKVKMHQSDELVIAGDSLNDKTIDFLPGTHLIPVLTNQTTGLDMIFDDAENDILYMLDIYTNQVYWPNGGLYTLTDLVPGKGYLANFKSPVTLSYPPLSNFTVDNSQPLPPVNGPWPCARTSNYHLISISAEAVNDLQNADYIGAFDSQGNCVGYAALEKTGQNILLTVYGDEPITTENDGLMEGELLRFRSFDANENTEKEFIASFNLAFPNTDGLFYANGLSGITGFKESATGVGENELAASVQVYPNPAKDVLNITLTGFKTLSGLEKGLTATLLTTEGKVVKTYPITSPTTQLDVADLQTGIYLLKITSENQIVVKRLVKQ